MFAFRRDFLGGFSRFFSIWDSKATIARIDAFFSIFRDLQDLHSFEILESQAEKTLEKPPRKSGRKENAYVVKQKTEQHVRGKTK